MCVGTVRRRRFGQECVLKLGSRGQGLDLGKLGNHHQRVRRGRTLHLRRVELSVWKLMRLPLLKMLSRSMGSGQSSKIASTWTSMKSNFQNFKSKMEARRFIPLDQVQDTQISQGSSSNHLMTFLID